MGETSFRRSVESGVVAILRATSSNDLLNATDAVLAGGVSSIEVTITTPGALRIVEEARARFGDEVSGVAAPASILTQRVVVPRVPILGVDDPGDALAVSLDTTGRAELDHIADLLSLFVSVVQRPTMANRLVLQ